jgi:hypothetical protein
MQDLIEARAIVMKFRAVCGSFTNLGRKSDVCKNYGNPPL